jgi:hypothetical protein
MIIQRTDTPIGANEGPCGVERHGRSDVHYAGLRLTPEKDRELGIRPVPPMSLRLNPPLRAAGGAEASSRSRTATRVGVAAKQ